MAHTFKEVVGVSPINYLIDRRMQEARNLLENTDFSIGPISMFCGYSSQSYFSQVFIKNEGMTPVEYRKQVKKI